MKTRVNDPIHNPFQNRFHDPVHSRLDEMQTYTHIARLHRPADEQTKRDQQPRYVARALAGAFALVLVVVVSAVLLSN